MPIFFSLLLSKAQEEIAIEAIKHAVKALWKRHLLEEGAHGPAFIALARPFASQCYKAQARLSEQLVVEVAESRASKALAVEKEAGLTKTQNELTQARDECSRLAALLEENTKGLDLLISENKNLKAQLEEMKQRANSAEAENRMLVDCWMLQKMQDAERLNKSALEEIGLEGELGYGGLTTERKIVKGARFNGHLGRLKTLRVFEIDFGMVNLVYTGRGVFALEKPSS
ncbi:hypothetical protein RJ639_034172 [Escallonia herrerae]|uniref:Autophagy-related protein 16 domain-containing protein n=1 Tax=Escallonia herrerae TaxID=1293975 RepID=A0AA88WZL1_9ASTE|nr:hypothetical protein RJ639_034172 [Escallonia herrerae]